MMIRYICKVCHVDMMSMEDNTQVTEPKYRKDLHGQIFGRWRVDEYVGTTHRGSIWRCTCLGCGTQRDIYVQRLTSGRTKSCGKEGCRTYTARDCRIRLTDPDRPDEVCEFMGRPRRIWLDLMEMADPKYRRCDKNGNLYNIKLQPRLKDWGEFMEWSYHDNLGLRTIPGAGTAIARFNSRTADLYHIPTHMMPDGSTPFYTYNLIWSYDDTFPQLTIRPDMKLAPMSRKYYLDPETNRPMSRQQLSRWYGIPVPTISAKFAAGMGLEELIEKYRKD